MATKDAPKDPAGPEEVERKDVYTFTPEEISKADTTIPDGDQWNKRDQAANDAVSDPSAPAPASSAPAPEQKSS